MVFSGGGLLNEDLIKDGSELYLICDVARLEILVQSLASFIADYKRRAQNEELNLNYHKHFDINDLSYPVETECITFELNYCNEMKG